MLISINPNQTELVPIKKKKTINEKKILRPLPLKTQTHHLLVFILQFVYPDLAFQQHLQTSALINNSPSKRFFSVLYNKISFSVIL